MDALNETNLQNILVERGICDRETAIRVSPVCQEIWAEAAAEQKTEIKIAAANAALRAQFQEALLKLQRQQDERYLSVKRDMAILEREVSDCRLRLPK